MPVALLADPTLSHLVLELRFCRVGCDRTHPVLTAMFAQGLINRGPGGRTIR